MDSPVKHLLEFGPFRIDPDQRLLLREEQPVPISPKAFDLLFVLTQRSGQVVLKDDLMKMLWPDTFVEESNLGQHVFQLRKALGERPQDHNYIITVPGRGYRFAQKVREVADEGPDKEEEQIVMASRSLARVVIEREEQRDLRFWLAVGGMLVAILFARGGVLAVSAKAKTDRERHHRSSRLRQQDRRSRFRWDVTARSFRSTGAIALPQPAL